MWVQKRIPFSFTFCTFLWAFLILFIAFPTQTKAQIFRNKTKIKSITPDSLLEAEGPPSARVIHGFVSALSNGEELPLASIKIEGTNKGVLSEIDGSFSILLDVSKPCSLQCSYLGFVSQVIVLNQNSSYVHFRLKDNFMVKKDVVISASRKLERKFESPVSIEMLNMVDLQNNATLNMYERIGQMTSVDVITTSVNFKALNTRGFNTTFNHRFIQRFDNMDLSMPGFNLSVGFLNGPIDLDVERVELIPGSSSALFGPNIINGLINSTSKSPFIYKGLSVNYKIGANHIDGIDNAPALLNDFALRYANTTANNKWAYKIVLGYMNATDWKATDYSDNANYSYSANLNEYGYSRGMGNPGYQAANILGDEVTNVFDSNNTKFSTIGGDIVLINAPLKIARTGYKEKDLLNYHPYSLKYDMGLHYKPNKNLELSWTSRISNGSSSFQIDNRIQINNFLITQHKFEIKGKNLTFRVYGVTENTGQAIDASLAAMNINRAAKDDQNWFVQYLLAYSGYFNTLNAFYNLGLDTIEAGNENAARRFANGNTNELALKAKNAGLDSVLSNLLMGRAQFLPGSKEFDSAYNYASTHSPENNGGLIKSTSKFLCSELLYDFDNKIKFVSILTGLNYKLNAPQTYGVVFNDKTNPIYSNEVGGFAQATKLWFDQKLKLQASGRLDYTQRFSPKFSPRISMVLLLGKYRQNSIRASVQNGFRYPALIDQFSYIPAVGATTIGGFIEDARRTHLIFKSADGTDFVNMYIQKSVNDFLASGDSSKLVKPNVKNIQPEKLRSFEIGYRTFLFQRLETDANFYFSNYQNLILTQQYIGAKNLLDTLNANYLKDPQKTLIFRQAVNSAIPANAFGVAISVYYYLNKKITLLANYNFNKSIQDAEFLKQDFIGNFNTPTNKYNLGFNGTKIKSNWGFSGNLKWVDQVHFKEYNKEGVVQSYYNLDLMVSYTLTKQNIQLKLGGTNVTNQRYTQSLGAPTVGAIFYFSILYDNLLK